MNEERAAAFERFYRDLKEKREELTAKMAPLKAEDKTRTAKFRDLMVQKLQINDILIRLETYGIKD
ncbi:MAG: hypothetical protein RSC08_07730 [Oscillospiraceae bacterium]